MVILIAAAVAIGGLAPGTVRPEPRRPWSVGASSSAAPIGRRRIAADGRLVGSLRLVGFGVAAVVAGPTVAALAGVTIWLLHRRAESSRSRTLDRRRRRELVEVAELLAIGLHNGHLPVSMCRSIPTRLDGETADALARAVERHDRGTTFADALEHVLTPLGADASALAALIASGATEGASLLASVADYTDDLRAAIHLEVETAARQLPVRMLGPLVFCVLPAFLALTVVPVVLDSVAPLLD